MHGSAHETASAELGAAGYTQQLDRRLKLRHLLVDGDFVHVANQLSNAVTTFRVGGDGILTQVGEPVPVPSPTCIAAVGDAARV